MKIGHRPLIVLGAAASAVLMALPGCTTKAEIRRPGGEVEYLIACGSGTGWNICYNAANKQCPTGYVTVSEVAGFNRKELRFTCPRP